MRQLNSIKSLIETLELDSDDECKLIKEKLTEVLQVLEKKEDSKQLIQEYVDRYSNEKKKSELFYHSMRNIREKIAINEIRDLLQKKAAVT